MSLTHLDRKLSQVKEEVQQQIDEISQMDNQQFREEKERNLMVQNLQEKLQEMTRNYEEAN